MIQFYKKIIWGVLCVITPFLSQAQGFKIVGYLTNWGISFTDDATSVDYSKVTHINIAFINPIKNKNGELGPTNGLATVVNTIHSNNVKVLISMGGATAYSKFPDWPTLITAENRGPFINKIMTFLNTYNIDGVDMDLEGNDVDANYDAFVAQLNDSLKAKNKLFSAALGTWFAHKISTETLNKFDWINAMAYDEYGTWTGPGEHSTFQLAEDHLDYWINDRGISKDKVVLGVPFYGYLWDNTKVAIGYCDIITALPRGTVKDTLKTSNNGFISYNGIPTIKQKTVLAIEECSGVMIWTLQFDCPPNNPNSLLSAINQAINEHGNNIAPTITLTGPSNGSTFEEGNVIKLTADAADEDGSISSVVFFKGSTKIGQSYSSPYSFDWTPEAGTYTIQAKALDNVPATTSSNTVTITVTPATTQKPFTGTPWNIPGKIEVEGFDTGSNLGYYDDDAANKGGAYRNTSVDIEGCTDIGAGYNIGYVMPGEWLEYTTEVAKDSIYDLEIRYASNNSLGGTLSLEMDGNDLAGTVKVNTTNGWQTWKSLIIPNIDLTKGSKILRINIKGGEFNLNYVNFTYKKVTTGIINKNENSSRVNFYPNPFTDNATIKLDIKNPGVAQLSIIDLTGKELVRLPESHLKEGTNYINVEASQLPKGFYLCKIVHNETQLAIPIKKQ